MAEATTDAASRDRAVELERGGLAGDGQLIDVVRRFESEGRPIVEPDLTAWLLGPARRIERDAEFFDALCWRLIGAGLPLWRITISVGTLHPQILGFGFRWWRDRSVTEVLRVRHGAQYTDDYLRSPIRPVIERGETVRCRLDDPAALARHPLLADLRAAGATDYYSRPLTFFTGRHPATTWTTDRPGGFSDADIARIEALIPALAVVIELKALRFTAGILLETYLGRTAGRRILAGEVSRARGEAMRAVILACDMRGFTHLSDRLPADELIILLDDYFEAVTAPVQARGGEVLKYIGDGILAIFPLADDDADAATAAALDTACESLARIERVNRQRAAAGRAEFRIGIGLHLGEIIFGNVGAADRLDFTAIGPAVNLAFRLESLTKRLDRPLLVSRDFARTCRRRNFASLGFHPVRGLSEPEEVFGLAEATGSRA